MAGKLEFHIETVLVNETIVDSSGSGNWQYVGATAKELESGHTVTLIAMKRDNSTGGVNFPASMLTATIMFNVQENDVAEHITIQGLHDISKNTNNEIGSVSSASRRFAEYIGGLFSFNGSKGLLTVFPRAS
jgi:hypothetical protein